MKARTMDRIADPRKVRVIASGYKRIRARHEDAVDDLTRARRRVAKALECLSDPRTVAIKVEKVLRPDADDLTAEQAHAIASWENARNRTKAYAEGASALEDALRIAEGR